MKTFLFFSQIIFLKNKQIIQMAEDGFDEFENPAFDKDDYDDIDERMPMVPDDVDQRIISNQNDSIADLRGQLRQNALDGQKQKLVKIFYDEIGKRYKMAPEKIDYNQFRISDDGKKSVLGCW